MFRYYEIQGEIEVLPDGCLYFVVAFWLDKIQKDAGNPPVYTNDFKCPYT